MKEDEYEQDMVSAPQRPIEAFVPSSDDIPF